MNIQTRSLMIDNGGGLHRISDWVILTVTTSEGSFTMKEPRQERYGVQGSGLSIANLDWSSEDHKITNLLFETTGAHNIMMAGGNPDNGLLHGGTLTPQTGR